MIIAIAGATGLTGKLTAQALLLNQKVSKVIEIGRRSSGLQNSKLEFVKLENNKLPRTITADGFICCLGTTIKKAGSQTAFAAIDLELPVSLATELFKNGCKSAAVVSAMGADSKSAIFYSRTKGEMEDRMKSIGFQSLTFLRPSLIEGHREESRLGEIIGSAVLKVLNPILVGPLRHYASIPANAIALRLAQAAIEGRPGVHVVSSGDIAI